MPRLAMTSAAMIPSPIRVIPMTGSIGELISS